jgi:shikimate kinase
VSVLNATATGIGCALAIDAVTTARWEPRDEAGIAGEGDLHLARAVARRLGGEASAAGAAVSVQAAFPPARGLKTSSSVAAALVRAGAQAAGRDLGPAGTENLSVAACRDAGITLTGALDDQAAVVRGGCHLTDNHAGRILESVPVPSWHVAVWVPDAAVPKARVAGLDTRPLAEGAWQAEALARAGRLAEAMTANGRLFSRFYAAHGLIVDDRPVQAALAAGAAGAGLSGTGPAVAALFDHPSPLPAVPGGAWRWHRGVP